MLRGEGWQGSYDTPDNSSGPLGKNIQQEVRGAKGAMHGGNMTETCLKQNGGLPASLRRTCGKLWSWEHLCCSCCNASGRLARSLWTPVHSQRVGPACTGPLFVTVLGSRLAGAVCQLAAHQTRLGACRMCIVYVPRRFLVVSLATMIMIILLPELDALTCSMCL